MINKLNERGIASIMQQDFEKSLKWCEDYLIGAIEKDFDFKRFTVDQGACEITVDCEKFKLTAEDVDFNTPLARFSLIGSDVLFDKEPIIMMPFSIPSNWTLEFVVEALLVDFRMVHDVANFADYCKQIDMAEDMMQFEDYFNARATMLVMKDKMPLEFIQELLEFYDPETPIKLV